MAIAYGSAGSPNAGTTSINVTLPATINAGDLILLWVVNKYPSNGPSEPSGWTTVGITSGGSGSAGVDSGSVYTTVFVKEADGTEGGTVQAVSIPSGNASRGMAWVITKSASMAWSWAYAAGLSPTPGNWSTTFNVNPGVTAGDLLWVFSGVNGDAATSWSAESLSIPGATLGAMTERHDATTTQGDDLGMFSSSHPVSSGTATGVGTYTATRAGSTTANSPAGASLLVRFREVTPTTTNIDPSGIASAQAFGTATIENTIDVSGIATAEAFGTAAVDVAIDGAGVASAEAFGTPVLDRAIDTPSIASAEAFGTAEVILPTYVDTTGIASAEAFGTATVVGPVDASFQFGAFQLDAFQSGTLLDSSGIASGEAVGTPTIAVTIGVTGIASGAAFGVATIDISFASPGIASAEAFGTPRLLVELAVTGIESAEAFGDVAVARTLGVTGIASLEAFGTAVVDVALDVTGIESAEAFGLPELGLPTPSLEEFVSLVVIDEFTSTLELDDMPFIIKAGNLAPGIAGSITAPPGIDLDGVTLTLRFKGRRTGTLVERTAINDGLAEDSPEVGDEPTTWRWHYVWQEGDTDVADTYYVGIDATVMGAPMTFPNDRWSRFYIQAQL